MLIAFVDLVSDLPKGKAGQLRHFSVVEAGDELLDLAAPLRRDDTEFGKMGAYGVDQHGALAHQQIACPMQHQDGLLLFVLDRHEYHVRPHQGLDNGGSVVGVVLLAALNVGLDLGGCDQPHRMAQRRNPASPVVGGSARLHAHDAGSQCLEKCFHASAAKLPAQYRSPGLVNRMDLKNVWLLSASGGREAREGGFGYDDGSRRSTVVGEHKGFLSSWPQWTQSTSHPCSTTRSASPWCASTAGQRASVALDAAATRWSGTGMTTHSRIGSGIAARRAHRALTTSAGQCWPGTTSRCGSGCCASTSWV